MLVVLAFGAVMAPAADTTIWVRAELTFASGLALVLGTLSIHGTTGRVRHVRSWITLAMGIWLIGEVIRDVEVAAGFHGVPHPSDLPFVGVVICAAMAFAAALRGRLRANEEIAVYLDGTIVFAAIAAVIVTTSGGGEAASLGGAIHMARAIFLLGIAGAILLLDLTLRAERRPYGAYVVLGGVVAMGAGILMEASTGWAAELDRAGGQGHVVLAFGIVTVALGTATWTDVMETDPAYVKFAERLRSLMPMVAVGLTAILAGVHFVRQLSGIVGIVNIAAMTLVLVTVAVRQSVLLRDREAAIRREVELGGELSTAEVRYQSLVERQPGVVYLAEPGASGRWHFVSPQLEEMLGFTPEEWMADPEMWARCIHPDDRDAVLTADAAAAEPGKPKRFEYRLCTRDDRVIWVIDDSTLTVGPGGQPLLQGLLVDITAAKVAEEALVASEEQQRMIIETASYAFVGIDGAGMVVDWNRQAEQTFGWPRKEAIGAELAGLIIPEAHRSAHREGLRRYGETGEARILSRRMELEAVHRDGHQFPVELTIWAAQGGDTVRFHALIDDITTRKELEGQLRHQALHDSLTGLANRVLFTDRVQHALDRVGGQRESSLAVLFLDLDDFKTVNDSLGHGAGDELLIAVGRRLGRILRPADTAARLGGDEFAVLLENAATEAPQAVAARVMEAFERPFTIQGKQVQMHASIGITLDTPTSTPDELLRNADIAMYVAKQRGKGRYELFEERMHVQAVRRLDLKAALERAIANDLLEIYYQPIVELREGTVVGFEALLRWRDADGQFIPVTEVIALAEETGLIVPIGRFVLREACRQAVEWIGPSNVPLHLAVNVSVTQLEEGSVSRDVRTALRQSGLPPSALVIEITESTLIDDSLSARRELRQLRKLGVRLAIDDFGTGYSSLGRLRRWPFDIVKIDRSFVSRITHEQEGAVVQSILEMASTMGLEVVAEGIETQAQLLALRARGCLLGQGFHFSRPVPPEAMAAILAVGRLPLPRRRLQALPARGA
ncbi:MAG TPA: EAL domain-containing protein [Candidatus Limnocylindrales bacterium]|nr:EAL domain-containing protein [Candidatus Limnocylindrales bacterium]